jgi:hypothetical protein
VIDHTLLPERLLFNFLYLTSVKDSCGNQPLTPQPTFFQRFVIVEISFGRLKRDAEEDLDDLAI